MKTGIWIDKNKAYIVTLKNKKEVLKIIASKIDFYKVIGGSGTRFKGGPQDVVQDSKYLKKENHQLLNYMISIVEEIKDTDELLIFGPAEMPLELKKHIAANHKDLFDNLIDLKKEDSMTENQTVAYVRDFFE